MAPPVFPAIHGRLRFGHPALRSAARLTRCARAGSRPSMAFRRPAIQARLALFAAIVHDRRGLPDNKRRPRRPKMRGSAPRRVAASGRDTLTRNPRVATIPRLLLFLETPRMYPGGRQENTTPGDPMLFKSPIFAQASGSIAGMTFSHNRGGQYVRSRVTPTDPGTPLQVVVRSAMTSLSARWIDTLTAVQRADWRTYAANVEMTNRVGDAVFLTGQQHYVRSGIPRIQIGTTPIDDAPTVFNLGDFSPPSFFPTATPDFDVTFDNADAWASETGSFMTFYASAQQSPSIIYHKGPYRYVGAIQGDDTTPPTSPHTFSSSRTLTVGNIVFARSRVSRIDGRLSGNIDLGSAIISP